MNFSNNIVISLNAKKWVMSVISIPHFPTGEDRMFMFSLQFSPKLIRDAFFACQICSNLYWFFCCNDLPNKWCLLQNKEMLKITQRLIALGILIQAYSSQPGSANPFISSLIDVSCSLSMHFVFTGYFFGDWHFPSGTTQFLIPPYHSIFLLTNCKKWSMWISIR